MQSILIKQVIYHRAPSISLLQSRCHISIPSLHGKSSQVELLKILPSLYNDLLLKKVDTLKSFQLDIRRINIEEPSELGLKIIGDMCLSAAEAIKLKQSSFSVVENTDSQVEKSNVQLS